MSNVTNIEEDANESRWHFEKEIMALYGGRSTKPEWSKERINVVISLIEEFEAASETKQLRNSAHYYYAKNYEIVEEGGRKCLVQKRKDKDDHTVKIVPVEEYYDILDEIHRSTGHGGRDKMLTALKYVCFIPTPAVVAFVKACQTCQRRKGAFKKCAIFLNRAVGAFSNRGLVKLMDMQSTPDEKYEWILHYQDCSTKFSFLRPLTSNDPAEVASELLKIFLEIGCPAILQTENRREYISDVIKELAKLWPSCKILNGRPFSQPTNPSAELIENVYIQLTAWMRDNSSCNWAKGLYFVQFQKNCTYHPCVQQTPYKALFGCDPKTGMQFKRQSDFRSKIYLEEDLECELKRKPANDIQHLLVESTNSCVQEVEYANPFSNVCVEVLTPECNNKEQDVLLEDSVQIKTEDEDTTGDETTHDVTTEVNVTNETMYNVTTEVNITREKMHNVTTEVSIEREGEYTTTDEPMDEPTQHNTYVLTPPWHEAFMQQSSHVPILCAVCGEKTVPTHSCESCRTIIHETCGITSIKSPKLLCRTCQIESVKIIIKTEYAGATGNETMRDVITEVNIKREGKDTTTDEPMNELTARSPEASIQSSSTHQAIVCAVCGDKTVPTHSCVYCHKIIHVRCGIFSSERPTLLCPTCHKDSIKKTTTLLMRKIDDDDVILVESPQFPVITDWEKTAPPINLERNLEEKPKVPIRVKRFGYSNVRCRCKESEKQCSSSRCLCQKKNQACTTNCHNPLKCKNQLNVNSK